MNAKNAIAPLNADELNSVRTFDELIKESGVAESDLVVILNPYTVLNKDKDALLNKPFFIRQVRFTTDDTTGNPFCVIYAVTRDNEMYVVTDGSTGIYKQLVKITEDYARTHSFLIANGLRKSDYLAENGQPATTYYLA